MILISIEKRRALWNTEHSIKEEPKYLYLGDKEMRELQREASKLDFIFRLPLERGEDFRPEYRGLKIFRVDAKSHLEIL